GRAGPRSPARPAAGRTPCGAAPPPTYPRRQGISPGPGSGLRSRWYPPPPPPLRGGRLRCAAEGFGRRAWLCPRILAAGAPRGMPGGGRATDRCDGYLGETRGISCRASRFCGSPGAWDLTPFVLGSAARRGSPWADGFYISDQEGRREVANIKLDKIR